MNLKSTDYIVTGLRTPDPGLRTVRRTPDSGLRTFKESVLALVCFLVIGAYVGSRPSQAEDAEAFAVQRSQGGRERASFTHRRKEHANVSCGTCHRVTPEQVDVTAFPGHATCIGCHNFAQEFFGRGVGFCGICHAGGPTSRARSALYDFQEKTRRLHAIAGSDFGIDFSHPDHRKPLPADFRIQRLAIKPAGISDITIAPGAAPKCTDCHKRIEMVRADERELSIEKGHSTCFQCHGMRPATNARENFPYMNDCKECHEIGGPKATSLTNIVAFRHADHDYDIRPRKKADYRVKRAEDFLCADCHRSVERAETLAQIRLPEQAVCGECHNGRIGLPDVLSSDVLNQLRQ